VYQISERFQTDQQCKTGMTDYGLLTTDYGLLTNVLIAIGLGIKHNHPQLRAVAPYQRVRGA